MGEGWVIVTSIFTFGVETTPIPTYPILDVIYQARGRVVCKKQGATEFFKPASTRLEI